jgi:chemotaxis protein histidine kinase CheA
MATNNTTVAITISADTQPAETSVKSFKTQLREANGELVAMSEKFGAASTEAVAAAKKVAGLKDAIGDAKALAETFNPDKKFVALGGAIQGAVSGFSALQGATALFGEEGKDLEKTLLKVQSVMALQQGISGVFGAIDSFKLLGNTIKTNVVSAFSSMKSAIISTGLGILVVAIGAVAEAFSSMADRAEEAAAATKKANEQALKYAEVGLKSEQEFIKEKEKLDIAKAKAAGKSENEIFKIQQKARASNIESLQRSYDEIKGIDEARADEIKKQIKQINNDGQVAELDNQTRLNKIKEDAAKQASDKRKEEAKKQLEELKAFREKLKELEKKLNEDLQNENAKTEEEKLQLQKQRDLDELNSIKLSETEKQEARKLIKDKYYIAEIDLANKRKQEQAEKDAKTLEEATAQFEAQDFAEFEKKKKKFNDTIELEKSTAKAIIEQKQALQQAEFNIASDAVNLLKMIAGKNEALQKVAVIADGAIGVAKIITSTMAANAAALATPQAIASSGLSAIPVIARNKISAAIGIATTVAATAKALSALGGGGGGAVGGGSLPGGSGGGASAPMLPQASSTTINQGQINQIGNVAARAFVVESDVSGNQERIQRLNRAARIS